MADQGDSIPPALRRLDALDRSILSVNGALRRLGAVGFETQMHIELGGRLSGDLLTKALTRLARRHPITAARLGAFPNGTSAWEIPSAGQASCIEADLPSAQPEAVHDYASQALSKSHDLAVQAPLLVHLLHRPGAGDVLLLQYSHLLMDNTAAGLLVRELDQALTTTDAVLDRPVEEPRGLVRGYLRQIPYESRRQAGQAIVQWLWNQFRTGAVLLNPSAPPGKDAARVRLMSASIEADTVQAMRRRLIRTCGYPSMSMGILASAFRLLERHALPPTSKKKQAFAAGIGVELGLRGPAGPIFQNLMTLVPMFAKREDLRDRDHLTRVLSQQFRDALHLGIDLGFLRFCLYSGVHPHTARWLLELFFRYGFSLWFAHFGAAGYGESLAGIPIESVRFYGPCWSPLGFTLLTNHYAGRLHLQVTYVPEVISEATADQLLHGIVHDMQM